MLKEVNNELTKDFSPSSSIACTCNCAGKTCTKVDSIGASPSESIDVAGTA